MLSLSLSQPATSHGVLLFAMLIVSLILYIEARRYRFFDLYRGRVRLLERHYYGRLLGGEAPAGGDAWLARLAEDLRAPRFTLSLSQALSRRLRRNYIWIYLILLLAWLLKSSGLLEPGAREAGFLPRAGIGAIPAPAVLVCVLLLLLTFSHREQPGELAYGEAHM
jgi:uncharacterized membrane protein